MLEGWTPQTLAGVATDDENLGDDHIYSAASLRNPNAVEAVVLGMRQPSQVDTPPMSLPRAARYVLTHPLSIRARTAAADAAKYVPGFRTQAIPSAPFLYHEQDSVESALLLWNLRAIRGAVFHGNEVSLVDYLTAMRAGRIRVVRRLVICLDPWPASAQALVASAGNPPLAHPVAADQMTWQPVLRPFLGGFDVELDDIAANDGKLELARRAPRTAGVGGQTELIQGDGAYAMELELEPADASSLRVSMPPRPEVGNMLLSSQPALPAFTRAGVQSRVRHRGDSVLAVLPVRWPRSVSLSIPSMGSILDASGQGHTFELSDKGHYGRWLAAKAGGLVGLHDLLLNPRSQAIISTFREHHLPGRKPTGAYRRFLSFAEMSAALRDQRRLGFIARRRRGALLDEEWLKLWIDQQVSAGVLRAGVWTRCRQCLAGSFLAFGSFAETFACPRCGAVARTPAVPKVGYQLAEVAHLFLANDCDMTALALSALARRSHGGFSFDFDHNVFGPKGQRNELDFFAILDGRLYVGESKKSGDFDRNDFDVIKRVARATQARAVVLAHWRRMRGRLH